MLGSQKYSRLVSALLFTSGCLVTVGMCRPLQAQDASAIRSEFRNPGKQYRPMVRWWWPGADVTDKEIDREIDILDKNGFGGAEIQPFVTFDTSKMSKEEAAKVNAYATPAFFHHVRVAADAAKAHHMWIDYTFGSGWPFGGGMAITPELSSIELRYADTVVQGPKVFSGKLAIPQWHPDLIAAMALRGGRKPDWPEGWVKRFEERSKIIAVVAMRSAPAASATASKSGPQKPEMFDRSATVILSNRMKPDGSLDWKVPDGTWHIFVFRQIPTRQPVIGASGAGPQLVLDHLNKAAFEAHAARVGDPMVKAVGPDVGSSLRAVFCDSLEVQDYLFWSDDFLQQFKKRRGYDLTPYLAVLRQPGYNDFYFSHPGGLPLFNVAGGDAIRADYWKTVSELIFEGFYHPFDEWAEQHNLLSRVQAHGAPGDLLKIYGDASIPETEELDGGNTVNFMKLASSAGYDYGRKLVSSESFDFRGNPYVTTPESIKANSDKLFISGINEIIYHGFPYKFDAGPKGIGWFPFQGQFSSQINESNPIWPFIGKDNQYITRMQFIAQTGKSDLQVAIFRSSLNEDDTGPSSASGPVKDPFPALEHALTAAGYSWGFVSEDVLLKSSAKGSTLTTNGGGRYAALVIPHEANVSPQLVKSLRAFAAARLPVVFVGGQPGEDVSFKNMRRQQESIVSGLRVVQRSKSVLQVANDSELITRLSAFVPPQLKFKSGAVLPFIKKAIGSICFYFLRNPSDKATDTAVEIPQRAIPEIWDPWTGDNHQTAFTRANGHVSLSVSLPPFGSELIAFNEDHQSGHEVTPATWITTKRQEVGAEGWKIDAVGDSAQGVGIHLNLKMATLTDWLGVPALRTFSGTATYTTQVYVAASDLRNAKRIMFDLGTVKDAAEVKINGVDAGQLIVPPFSVAVRHLLHSGVNTIKVTVANSLTNYASTIHFPNSAVMMRHYPPISAGMLGPVLLQYETSAPSR